jgi:hypothetical protein
MGGSSRKNRLTEPPPESLSEPGAEYDLVYVRAHPWGSDPPRTASLLDLAFEFQGESLSLEIARSRRRSLDRHGITALIVPLRYREPALSITEARHRAEEVARSGRSDRKRGDSAQSRLLGEHPMFYTFRVPASGADRDGDPTAGTVVAVDRCDGHIWTDQEMDAYFTMIGPR